MIRLARLRLRRVRDILSTMRIAIATLMMCVPLAGAPLTQAEREMLVGQLDRSAKVFLGALGGISEAQWKFKPGPDRWSIAHDDHSAKLTSVRG